MATKPAFSPNAQVEHPKFGCGTVVSCDDDYVVISFDEHGEKKFISSIAVPSLKKINRTPPVEKRVKRARRKSTKKVAKAAGKSAENTAAAAS